MDVRLARPTDAPVVLSLILDDASHLVKSPTWPAANPIGRSMARTLFPLALAGRSWIGCDRSARGMLEAQPRRYVIGWDITRLVIHGDPSTLLPPLLGAATAHLQSKGVPRLFARCRDGSQGALEALEFRALAREFVLVSPQRAAGGEGELPINSRYRIPPDAWPLHQLENEVTPPLVRQIVGATSLDWSRADRDMNEIVVEHESKIVAWIGWGNRSGHHYTDVAMIVHPEYSHYAPDLLDHALKQLKPGYRLLTRVREYHPEVLNTYLNAGFQIVAEELLMMKHAGIELARTSRSRLHVAPVPSMQGFRTNIGCVIDRTCRIHSSPLREEHST